MALINTLGQQRPQGIGANIAGRNPMMNASQQQPQKYANHWEEDRAFYARKGEIDEARRQRQQDPVAMAELERINSTFKAPQIDSSLPMKPPQGQGMGGIIGGMLPNMQDQRMTPQRPPMDDQMMQAQRMMQDQRMMQAQRMMQTPQPQVPQTGLIGSEQALQGGLQGGLNAIASGTDLGAQQLQPYASQGGNAFGLQSNLSGANGLQAQQQAFANYQSSPEQAYLRQQGEQALMRNSAAMGGLGGGNVRKELQLQGIGQAAQDYGNSFNRLGTLSNMGLNAASRQAEMGQAAGMAGAQAYLDTGGALSTGRTRFGENLASATQNTGSALADLVQTQGVGNADLIGQSSGSLADILAQQGMLNATSLEGQGAALANLASGAASQRVGISPLAQLQANTPFIETLGKAAGGVGAGMTGYASM